MNCIKCGEKSKVINVARDVDQVIRLRECTVCKTRFYTSEIDLDYNDGRTAINQLRNYTRHIKRCKND